MAEVHDYTRNDLNPRINDQHDRNLAVATTASFVNVLTINMRDVRDSIFIIHNSAAGDLSYEILGNAKAIDDITAPTGTDDDDNGWISITTGTVATTAAPAEITETIPYTQVVIRIKHVTLTTNVDIYHRGET